MEEKRIYLIAQFDRVTCQKLTEIYNELAKSGLIGEQTKDIPYHITLGDVGISSCAQVMERVQKVCFKTKRFEINLSHIATFGLHVLFIAPAVNTELLKLYSNLVPEASVSGYHTWVPHTTMLMDNPVNIQTAIPIVAQAFTPFRATIESVGVLAFPPAKLMGEFSLSV